MVERKSKQESKFAGIFQNAAAAPAASETATERGEIVEAAPSAKPLGRPPGKRSDPEWKQFSVLLRKRTQREAAIILRSGQDGEGSSHDLSDLLQQLLERWVDERRHT
jgi:hypothetical protein